MSVPVRSIRLQRRSTKSLDTLSGSSGEIFFDEANSTLRLYTANQSGSTILATRDWTLANTFSGDYQDLTNKPVIPTDLRDLTDIDSRLFSGDYNDLVNAPDLGALQVDITTINSIGDVDTQTTPPSAGEVLQWDGTNWVNANVAGITDTNTTYTLSGDSITGGGSINLTDSDANINSVSLIAGTGIGVSLTSADTLTISNTATYGLNDLTDVSYSPPVLNQVLGWNGTIWTNITPAASSSGINLTDLSVTVNTAGTANLTYDNTTGVFSYTPPDLSGIANLSSFSVTTSTASGGGSLSYNNTNGSFTFRPANLTGLIGLTNLSVTQNVASGTGTLSYDNTTGVFSYTPPDLTGLGGINNVVEDLTPELGGTLDALTNDIVNVGTITATTYANAGTGAPTITSASTITLDAPDGTIVQSGPFRLPSFTTTQKNALIAVNGDMVYDSTLNKAQVFENGAWANLV